MNDTKYRWILYTIVAVIVSTIAIQVYWNFKNYEVNKQQLINDVQVSLDNAVETYYTNLAKEETFGFAFTTPFDKNLFVKGKDLDSAFHYIDINKTNFDSNDSIRVEINNGVKILKGKSADSALKSINKNFLDFPSHTKKYKYSYNTLNDSIVKSNFEMLTSKVIISLATDSLQLKEIDSIFKGEIDRKNLEIDYKLNQTFDETHNDSLPSDFINSSELYTISKSPFLPPHNKLVVGFSNSTKEILKRILTGILISTLLVLAVISCLFYLLKIIKHQKQLAEVKNDLISNITHEFKTPIATIGVALESIKNFNVINDKKKTKSYLDMSINQLSKLNLMVEKLLETATLDSENIDLKKEPCDIVELIEALVKKHSLATSKEINFHCNLETHMADIDVFHFENAINNVLDNAVKYGGKIIDISLRTTKHNFTISISDNGNTLTNANKQKIFEKFYRVPKGNTHDVKGFGIGLYYTKKIIEKHNGHIELNLDNELTTFNISVPNE